MSATLNDAISALQAAKTSFEAAKTTAVDLLLNPPVSGGVTPEQIARVDAVTAAVNTAASTINTALAG